MISMLKPLVFFSLANIMGELGIQFNILIQS